MLQEAERKKLTQAVRAGLEAALPKAERRQHEALARTILEVIEASITETEARMVGVFRTYLEGCEREDLADVFEHVWRAVGARERGPVVTESKTRPAARSNVLPFRRPKPRRS